MNVLFFILYLFLWSWTRRPEDQSRTYSVKFSAWISFCRAEERASAALTVITHIRLISEEILHWSAAASISAALWSDVWQQIKRSVNSQLDPLQSDKSVDSARGNWDDHRAFWVMRRRGCAEVTDVKTMQGGWKFTFGFLWLLRRKWSLFKPEVKVKILIQINLNTDVKRVSMWFTDFHFIISDVCPE